jgi:hypothetical protein
MNDSRLRRSRRESFGLRLQRGENLIQQIRQLLQQPAEPAAGAARVVDQVGDRAEQKPRAGAAAAYEALLATCWDALHAAQPAANVIATSAPHARPGDWYAALGKAYRASGRTQPSFDTVGHNAYPDTSAEPPDARHRHAIDEGDLDRLVRALRKAFGVVPPIWYLEDGFQSSGLPPLYSGVETDRRPVSEDLQAAQLAAAVRLAYCQPGVTGFFNFELRDDASLAGWQSGLLRPDWSPKPAFAAYRQAIAAARAGELDCTP